MANHKVPDEDRRTVLVGFKASEIDLAVIKAARGADGTVDAGRGHSAGSPVALRRLVRGGETGSRRTTRSGSPPATSNSMKQDAPRWVLAVRLGRGGPACTYSYLLRPRRIVATGDTTFGAGSLRPPQLGRGGGILAEGGIHHEHERRNAD
jgi:hypothetical protein